MNVEDLPKINVASMREGLSFDELDRIEAMTGMSLEALETKAQSKLTRAMLIIGWARAGHAVEWADLSEMGPTDFIANEEEEEDPTEPVSSN